MYGVCEPDEDAVRKFIGAIQSEWRRIFRSASPGEVQRAKNLLKTLLLAQCDGSTAVCEDIGRQMLTYGRRIPLAEIDARVEAVTPSVLKKVVGEYVYDRDPVLVGLGELLFTITYGFTGYLVFCQFYYVMFSANLTNADVFWLF